MQNLRMIDLSGSARFVLGQPSNPVRRFFYKLKSGNCFTPKIHPHFHEHLSELQGLEHLVSGSEKPVSSHSVAALALLPHLKDLDLTGSIMSDDGLFQIRGLTSLTSLQLEGCGRLQPHIMKVCSLDCSTSALSRFPPPPHHSSPSTPSPSPLLRSTDKPPALSLSRLPFRLHCPQPALRGLSSLTHLNLKGCCKGVTNGLVASLSCPRLRSFNMHGCNNLTGAGLSHLAR